MSGIDDDHGDAGDAAAADAARLQKQVKIQRVEETA